MIFVASRIVKKKMFCLRNFSARFASYKGVDYTPSIMPKLSPTATESKVEEWLVSEGDFIEPGDSYCNVETDKASVSHDAQEEGYIAKIFKSDEKVAINSIIGIQVENESDVAAFKDFALDEHSDAPNQQETGTKEESKPEKTKDENELAIKVEDKKNVAQSEKPERILATPFAKKLAAQNDINLLKTNVAPSGLGGVFIEKDVRNLIKRPAAKSASSKTAIEDESQNLFTDVPLTAMRETIAKRLLESKQTIPHFNVEQTCNMERLITLRKKLNEIDGVKISINDFVLKASALALRKVPEVNSSWQHKFIRTYRYADVSVAVSTPTGLLTPIVKRTCCKGLDEISKEVRSLAAQAKEGSLKPAQFVVF
ncbi:hypothetical protein MHBO_002910 [Bonamia ostreae]|uniref:Dihydrolipoamide acetyltransferase component of pyruvate dehydrogenase complex n=1 Tax=Bonamia ostreae TaxID=126728 RepID=A0ABV2ANX8_9EUKA